jgi:sugar phosphate isomerase/epimerase
MKKTYTATATLLAGLCITACAAGFDAGVAAYSFRQGTAFEAIEKTKACGGDVIEFFLWQSLATNYPGVVLNQNLSAEHLAALKAKLVATGVKPGGAYFNNSVFASPADIESNLRKLFTFARELGLRNLTGEPPKEHLDLIERMVKEYDVQLCIHAHPKNPAKPDYRNWDPAYLLSLLEGRDPRMGISLDTGHVYRSGLDAVAVADTFKDRILSVHLKDVVEAKIKSKDVPYGQGIGDIPGVLNVLKKRGFKGYIAVEFDHLSDDVMRDVKQCLDVIRHPRAE